MANIEVTAVNADESIGAGFGAEFTFTLTLTEAVNDAVTVQYRTIAGSALERIDYPGQLGTVTFAPNELTQTITFRATSDNVDEFDEALVLELFNPDGAGFADNQHVLRTTAFVLDDDGVGNDLSMFVSSPVIVEGHNGTREAIFDVSLSRASASTLTFDYATVDGTAVAGSDYVAKTGSLSFAPGQTSREVRVTVTGDRAIEPSEFFSLLVEPTAALADGGIGAAGTATILDDDAGGALPTVSIEGISATESIGSGFGGPVKFLITLSAPSTDEVTVEYRALPGTAWETLDYERNSRGTVTFAPGETSQQVIVSARHNGEDEDDEAFVLELFDPGNAVLAGGAKVLRETAFVLDDDGVGLDLALFVSSPVMVEGNSGTTAVTFDIELSRPTDETLTFNYATEDGSAAAPSDYTGASGAVSFAPGETHKTVTVTVAGDMDIEASEFFNLVVEPTAALGDNGIGATGTATILDDDAGRQLPTVSVEGISAIESIGSGFGGPTQFIVTLSRASTDEVTVQFRTRPGTAQDTVDYDGDNGTVTFAPGETSQLVLISANHDNVDEADEAFVLELFNPGNARLAGGGNVLREAAFVQDDDGTGSNLSYFVADVDVVEGNSGQSQAVFEVELSRPVTETISLNYATQDGSARAGQDYVARTGTLVFDPGQTRASVSVPVLGELLKEGSETFDLFFTNRPSLLASAFLGVAATATILNDEIVGTNAADKLNGGPGQQAIYGLGGADVLRGHDGPDLLSGDGGADVLFGGAGRDQLFGGGGNDTASYAAANRPVKVSLMKTGFQNTGEGADLLRSIENLTGSRHGDKLDGDGGANVLRGLGGNDRITGLGGKDRAFGDAGNDRIAGGGGNDIASGGSGNDTMLGNAGNDILRGQGGNDLINGGGGNDRAFGEAGRDRVVAGSGNDFASGGNGHDTVLGGAGADVLRGDAGNDLINGGGGSDRLNGNGGKDELIGGAGGDRLFGDAGNDVLEGGSGNDQLFGGTGADVFGFGRGDGIDRVRDFGRGRDTIELDAALWKGNLSRAEVIDRFAEDRGANVAFDFGKRGTLIVEDVNQPDDLTPMLAIV